MTEKQKQSIQSFSESFCRNMTEEQKFRIAEVYEENKSDVAYRILAKEFGVSLTNMQGICMILRQGGVLRYKQYCTWSLQAIENLKSMIDAGHSISEIALTIKKSYANVRNKVIDIYGGIPIIDIPGEEWQRVEETNYEVSNHGRFRRVGQRNIISGSLNKDGYIDVSINKRVYRLHRLVAQAFIPNPRGKEIVDHIDGNRANNCVSNLRWVTAQENSDNQHRAKTQMEAAEERRRDKKIKELLKELFETGISRLELIRRIVDYDEKGM